MTKEIKKELHGENEIMTYEILFAFRKVMLANNVDMLPAMVNEFHDHKKQLAQKVSRDSQAEGALRELLNLMRAAAKDTDREHYYTYKIEEIEKCLTQCDTREEANTKDFSKHFKNFPYAALSKFLFDYKILKKEFDEQNDKEFFENVVNSGSWSKLNEYLVSNTKTKWRCVIHRVSDYIKDRGIKREYKEVSASSIGISSRQLTRHNTKTIRKNFDEELKKVLF